MRNNRRFIFIFFSILSILAPVIAQAADLELERTLHRNFNTSRVLLAKIEQAMLRGESSSGPLAELKELGASVRKDHQAFLEQLRARGSELDALGEEAATRHAAVQEHYEQLLTRYLSALAALDNQQVPLAAIRELQQILSEILPERKLPIHGSLPYRHLNLPAQSPKTAPVIVPAYQGGTADFGGADLAASPEAPISLTIASLAQDLAWNPVTMYEWVKNNITTEWYWGAMKGAEETLRQGSGNDADQAALLVALFRAAGFPARYVRGVLEFFPDLEGARAQTGLDAPLDIARFFQKAGIPYETVIAGGRISNFRIEHIWVEVAIPYDNYRGSLVDELGASWLALDTSIKVVGSSATTPAAGLQTLDLAGIGEGYLAGFRTEAPLDYLAAQLNEQLAGTHPGVTYADLLLRRTINQEHMQIIPAGLQFTEIAVTGEYARLPAELLHQARFIAKTTSGATIFDQTLPIYKLSNRSLAVTFEPETIEDQEIMNAYGSMDLTPLYLIRLRPVLTVAGAREIVGQGGLTAGSNFSLAVELAAPWGRERVEKILVAGYPTLIAIAAQQAVMPETIPLGRKNGERLLYERAMSYIDLGNKAEEELAALLQLNIARPLPTLVALGGVLDVVSLLGTPYGFTWQGLYLDAALRVVEALGGVVPAGIDPGTLFMGLAALQNSHLEHRIFEEGFGVESVSTAKLLALANDEGLPLAVIDAANVNTALPALNLPAGIRADIAAAVNQGCRVTIPASEMVHEDWSGHVFRKENPATSESGWMLAGAIAGGMTAWNPERWPEEYREILTHPGVDSSGDPASAVELRVLRGQPDSLTGIAGRPLAGPVQVLALDEAGKPVRGVELRFAVKAGGGKVSLHAHSSWQQEVLVQTAYNGVASVDVLCSQSTAVNPTTARRSSDPFPQRVDETVIEVTSISGLRTSAPVSVFGFPDAPHRLQVTGGGAGGTILTWAATLIASVEDKHNNPRNGEQVAFSMGPPRSGSACGAGSRPGLLIGADDPCVPAIPVNGQCGSGSLTGTTGLHLGAVAHVLLGDLPAADYPVTIRSGELVDEVTVASHPAGTCDPEDAPYSALVLRVLHDTDEQGNIITAGPVSTPGHPATVPLLARMYALREQAIEVNREVPCLPSGTDTCPVRQGTGAYEIDSVFVSASVSFAGTPAEPLGGGLYRVNFPVSSMPTKHEIDVTGEATVREKITVDICDERNECRLVEEERPLEQVHHATTVYAVEVTVPSKRHIIPVNEEGYVTADSPLAFTIAPPEYIAATADVVLSEKTGSGEFEEIAYFSAETSGQGGMTFLPGFRFDQEKAYRAQVVLNEGSDAMEIRSREMTIQPLTLELDADLNRDGQWQEDDPLEHTAPGLVIPLNLDDDDRDGVADNIDGYDADGTLGNRDDSITKGDDDLIEIKLRALPAGLAEGTVALTILQGADKVKVWTDRNKGAEHLLIDGPANPASAARTWTLGADIADLASLPQSLYIEGINPSTNRDDTAILVTTYRSVADQAREVELDRLQVAVMTTALVPNFNRDRVIDNDDRNKVTEETPWRFWVNDDDDGGADGEGIGGSENDLPGRNKDNEDFAVNGIRDLIDFFPLHLDMGKALAFWPPAEGYEYILRNISGDGSASPGLAVVEGMAGASWLSADGVNQYLEDPVVAGQFASSQVKPLSEDGVKLSAAFLDQLNASPGNGIILVEGRRPWSGQITLEIRKSGAVAHATSLPLEVVGVEEMFGHKNLRGVAGATDGDPDRYVEIDPETGKLYVGDNQEIGKQPSCMQGVDRSLVWMHGYNNSPTDARATFAEVFKRFFHAGLTGRFYGVSWYGDPPAPLSTSHYHQAVVNAFATAGEYARFVGLIPGSTSIAAHSLGNLVVGSAIQDHGLENFTKYFAVDAAVALEAYGQVAVDEGMIRVDDWLSYWQYEGVDAQGNLVQGDKLLASEWHTLFSPSDNRHQLTWRDRLGTVPSDKVFNFFSSTEDVLRAYPDDDLVNIFELLKNLDNFNSYLSISTWVKQEKFKGRRSFFNIASNLCGFSSSYCGWSFNTDWDVAKEPPEDNPDGTPVKVHRTPAQAALIPTDALQKNPFFSLPTFKLFGADLAELVSDIPEDPAPSTFVMKNISETDLTGYYENNQPAHELVKVRDWLLAEAFPATTLPMGAKRNPILYQREQNVDMSGVKDETGGCCKTSEDLWPREDPEIGRPWFHSDYKVVPYQHVNSFYKKIKELIGN
ncbi:MAG TPA: hypothetical protein DDY20_08085 [Desulfobulbaceae bacterium]|nr:hypothetical protein [Desulfobulbaceae bacterium]